MEAKNLEAHYSFIVSGTSGSPFATSGLEADQAG